MANWCYCYVEDAPFASVAQRILAHREQVRGEPLRLLDGHPVVMRGYGRIRSKMGAFVNMARAGSAVLVFADLDTAVCASELRNTWLPQGVAKPERLVFRIAVRQVESWLLADRESLASFLSIPVANFPAEPDALPNAKRKLLEIIQSKGRRKWHGEMLPRVRTASIGPRYNERLCAYIGDHWDPARAARRSPSLARALEAVLSLGPGN